MWVRFGCSVFLLCNSRDSCRVVGKQKPRISSPSTGKIDADNDTSLFSSTSVSSLTSAGGGSTSSLDGSFRRNTVKQLVDSERLVTELGCDDPARNIVERIFRPGWPSCKIERVLKINNTHEKITEFEDYRDCIKTKSGGSSATNSKYPRCAVDGNEVLRFHSTVFTTVCSIIGGNTRLCCGSSGVPECGVCGVIRDGFKVDADGRIRTLSSGGQSSNLAIKDEKKAMLVCRVIAGLPEYDSLASSSSDELFLFNPKAVLACFLVIYN